MIRILSKIKFLWKNLNLYKWNVPINLIKPNIDNLLYSYLKPIRKIKKILKQI